MSKSLKFAKTTGLNKSDKDITLTNHNEMVSSRSRIPAKKFHVTSLAKAVKQHQSKIKFCDEIEHNSFSFYTGNFQDREIKASIVMRRIVLLHKWKSIQVSALGFANKNSTSLKKITDLVGRGYCKLSQLRIKFPFTEWVNGNEELEWIISNIIKNIPESKEFGIIIALSPSTTEKGLSHVVSTLVKNLPRLESLRLNTILRNCPEINNKPFITKITRNLPKLKALYLNLGGECTHDDESVSWIAEKIGSKMTHLEHFKMYFWGAVGITDKGLSMFAAQICRKLVHLRFLHLNFRSCENISLSGTDTLVEEICQNLFNLKKLIFIFDGCSGITGLYLKAIKIKIQERLPKLKKISFDDSDCNELDF